MKTLKDITKYVRSIDYIKNRKSKHTCHSWKKCAEIDKEGVEVCEKCGRDL